MKREETTAVETIYITVPDPMKEFVEELVQRGDYSSASEYIHALIREDRKRREMERLEAMLLEGLASGPMAEMTPDEWASIRAEVRSQIVTRQVEVDGTVQSEDR
jgi:antitoxin ParD1/3/4